MCVVNLDLYLYYQKNNNDYAIFLIFAVALSIAGAVLASQKSTPNEDEMIMASVEALSNDGVVVGNPASERAKKMFWWTTPYGMHV